MKLYSLKNTIDYNTITLAEPNRLQGGNSYYSKIYLENNPFLFQLPRCSTKNGIVKTNKTTYCDLLFQSENKNAKFIEFIEILERNLKEKLYEKTSLWFHNELEMDDIEYFFNSSLKPYKGVNYLFRTYIPNNTKSGISKNQRLQIYDEDEIEKSYSDVENNDIITIVHFKGIKFTSSSFHLDIELKQVMIMEKEKQKVEDTFSKCLIKKDVFDLEDREKDENQLSNNNSEEEIQKNNITIDNEDNNNKKTKITENYKENNNQYDLEDLERNREKNTNKNNIVNTLTIKKENEQNNEEIIEQQNEEINEQNNETLKENIKQEIENYKEDLERNREKFTDKNDNFIEQEKYENNDTNEIDETNKQTTSSYLGLEEINLDINDTNSVINLKNPNEVYYEIYKKAHEEAILAKNKAIKAFLELKNIKRKYLIDEIESSDDDDDNEIDSEIYNLENLY